MTFPIVYPDPMWGYNQRATWSDTTFGGGATGEYDVTDTVDMEAMGEQFHAMRPADGGVMLMWVTGPFMEAAPKVMRAWGYTPIKPIFYWVKTYPKGGVYRGPGAYTQSNVEFVLLGQASMSRKLMPINRKAKGGSGIGVAEVFYEPDETDYPEAEDEAIAVPHPRDGRGKIIHSKKPRIFYDKAVELFGDLPRVEVFARERYAGWHAIGDQLPGGERIEPGRIITPLPPPAVDIAHRRHGAVEQRGLFGAFEGEVSA